MTGHRYVVLSIVLALGASACATSASRAVVTLPNAGQPANLQAADAAECEALAKDETKDASTMATIGAIGITVGAAAGALTGTVLGALFSNPLEGAARGAAVGAGVGGLAGLARAVKEHDAAILAAYRTCMEARGYTTTP